MDRLEGVHLDQAELSDVQRKEADEKLAAMAARMHAVKGEGFGYRQNGLHRELVSGAEVEWLAI